MTITYAFGFSATEDYEAHAETRLSRHKLVSSLLRAVTVAVSGLIAAHLALKGAHSLGIGLRLGFAAGAVSGLVGLFSPTIEWWIENIPERRLGVLGLGLIFFGMLLQSVQYWVVVLNVGVR